MCTKLCIIHYGETDWNCEGRIQGHPDIQVNEVGRWWPTQPPPSPGPIWCDLPLLELRIHPHGRGGGAALEGLHLEDQLHPLAAPA